MGGVSISIAMATYNGVSYLSEQLDSIFSQSKLPLELIVCDDGSTDGTVEMLKSYSLRAPMKILIVENRERLGYKANFLKAAALCRGDVIAFSDQDDIWGANKLKLIESAFSSSDIYVVSHDFSVFFEDNRGVEITSYYESLSRMGFSVALAIKGCSMAYRRCFLDQVGWPKLEHDWAHDNWLGVVGTLMRRRGYVTEPLIRHRIHQCNASGWLMTRRISVAGLFGLLMPALNSDRELDQLLRYCVSIKGTEDLIRLTRQLRGQVSDRRIGRVMSAKARKSRNSPSAVMPT